jgi:Methyltransferase domain
MSKGGLPDPRSAGKLASALVHDPLEVLINIRERIAERGEGRAPNGFMPWPPCPYREDDGWEERLHGILGLPWPCDCVEQFDVLWRGVIDDLGRRRLDLGRGAFGGWGDGEPGFVRAVWSVVRHQQPAAVVETGVARGITTRFILEAFERNGKGHLWSIDLPPPLQRHLHHQIGMAVPESLRSHWSYVRGSSRRRLRGVLGKAGRIDLFVHDSRHSERNLLFEIHHAWDTLRSGGFLIADDVDLNCGFHAFRAEHADDPSLICLAEPLRLDPGRARDRGVFAVTLKQDE